MSNPGPVTPLSISPLSCSPLGVSVAGAPAVSSVTITVPAASIASDLTSFVTPVDLSGMPSYFWSNVNSDGSNVRVFSGETRIPVDVVVIDVAAQTGWLFFGPADLSSSVDTAFTVDFAGLGETSYDMDNVWADYAAVAILGAGGITNRTGGAATAPQGTVTGFQKAEEDALTTGFAHQGIAYDGTHYYLLGGDETCRKYQKDEDGRLDLATGVILTKDLIAESGLDVSDGVDHMGDGCVVDGTLWVGMTDSSTNGFLVAFDASDLTFIKAIEITSTNVGTASSVAYNPADGLLYVADYANGDAIYGWDPVDETHDATITFSPGFGASSVQGITFYNGKLYVSDDTGDEVHECELDGTVNGVLWSTSSVSSGFPEGLDYNDEGLLQTFYAGPGGDEVHYRVAVDGLDLCAGGGTRIGIGGNDRILISLGAGGTGTTFSVGISFGPADETQDSMFALSTADGSDTYRVAAAIDDGDSLSVWDNSNSWLDCNPDTDPALEPTMHRVHVVYVGTTERRIYYNGGSKNTDSTITQKGAGGGAEMFFVIGDGVADGSSSKWEGRIGLGWVRADDVGDAWIAAEFAALDDNGSFLTLVAA